MTLPVGTDRITRIVEVEPGEWLVAVNNKWLAGVYDSCETAVRATGYADWVLERLLSTIYRFDGQGRSVTQSDLDKIDDREREEQP